MASFNLGVCHRCLCASIKVTRGFVGNKRRPCCFSIYRYAFHFDTHLLIVSIIAPIIGHVGDGNFHSLIMIDPNNTKELKAAKELAFRMSKYAFAKQV